MGRKPTARAPALASCARTRAAAARNLVRCLWRRVKRSRTRECVVRGDSLAPGAGRGKNAKGGEGRRLRGHWEACGRPFFPPPARPFWPTRSCSAMRHRTVDGHEARARASAAAAPPTHDSEGGGEARASFAAAHGRTLESTQSSPTVCSRTTMMWRETSKRLPPFCAGPVTYKTTSARSGGEMRTVPARSR
jgi:hypothetical protein